MLKQISDNEIYLSITYIKSVPWKVVKCLSYIHDARCLKVNLTLSVYLSFEMVRFYSNDSRSEQTKKEH